MREIKFRAWWRDAKLMAEVVRWEEDEVSFIVPLKPNSLGQNFEVQRLDAGQYDLMQFTGLKDKNGKEIYEGDVVKYEVWERFHEECSNVKKVVNWNDKQCGWNPMCQHTDVEDGYYNWEIENVEVIGNIYENQDLLETN